MARGRRVTLATALLDEIEHRQTFSAELVDVGLLVRFTALAKEVEERILHDRPLRPAVGFPHLEGDAVTTAEEVGEISGGEAKLVAEAIQ
jgi:hypothetical protein